MPIKPNHEHVSQKKLTRDEWITADILASAVRTVDAYYCKRNPEDSEADPDTLKNITDALLEKVDVKQIENFVHLLSFLDKEQSDAF